MVIENSHKFFFFRDYFILFSQHNFRISKKLSKMFWSIFSRIWTEYGEIRIIFLYSNRMREDTDQNNSEYGNFLRSVEYVNITLDIGTATNVYKLL